MKKRLEKGKVKLGVGEKNQIKKNSLIIKGVPKITTRAERKKGGELRKKKTRKFGKMW